MAGKTVFLHEIKLEGDSEFVNKFNDVSNAFDKAYNDETLSEEEQKEAREIFFQKSWHQKWGTK